MEDHILHVQMLGGFSMEYNGKRLASEKNFTSKSSQLLQLLFLHMDDGIPKKVLLDALYGREEVENQNGSLNNTIFRLRRQLEALGLPESKYFNQKSGIYRWEKDIPTEVDIHCFEEKVTKARELSDEQEREKELIEACSLYTGEFLPTMIGEDWATVANVHYQDLYFSVLEEVCMWLKKQEKYEKIYDLTTAASKIYPFEEWQLWRIDSLIAMNHYQEAMEIYKDATRLFFDEMGLSPSEKMLERFQLMSSRLRQPVSAVEEIRNGLRERESRNGAYYCTFPSFIDVYHVISRIMERRGVSVFIMLCTLMPNKGDIQIGTERNKGASEQLRWAIGSALRKGDFYTSYSENQYLVMLIGTKQENCGIIAERIDAKFKENFNAHYRSQYYVASVADLLDANEDEEKTFQSLGTQWDEV